MPSNNNKKSISNKTSNSGGSSNTNWGMLGFVSLAIILFVAYYFAYKSNREAFKNDDSSSSTASPNLSVSSGEKVVALFYADWCPHCVDFKPHYKKAMSELNGKKYKGKTLRFIMVDCDKYKSLASQNDVSGFPTVKILNDDKSSDEYSGDRSYEGLSSYFA